MGHANITVVLLPLPSSTHNPPTHPPTHPLLHPQHHIPIYIYIYELNRQASTDITFGIVEALSRGLGISPWELETPEERLYDRQGGTDAVVARSQVQAAQGVLCNSAAYVWGSTMAGNDENATVVVLSPVGAQHVLVTSATTNLYSADEIQKIRDAHPMLPMLLFVHCIFEEDRRLWLELNVDMCFGQDYLPRTNFIKIFDRHGEISNYLFTFRAMPCQELQTECFVTCVAPAPPSRHVVELPGHPYKILNQLRKREKIKALATGAAEAMPPPPVVQTTTVADAASITRAVLEAGTHPPAWLHDPVSAALCNDLWLRTHQEDKELQQQQQQQQQPHGDHRLPLVPGLAALPLVAGQRAATGMLEDPVIDGAMAVLQGSSTTQEVVLLGQGVPGAEEGDGGDSALDVVSLLLEIEDDLGTTLESVPGQQLAAAHGGAPRAIDELDFSSFLDGC